MLNVRVLQSPRWHLQISCFAQPTAQNPKDSTFIFNGETQTISIYIHMLTRTEAGPSGSWAFSLKTWFNDLSILKVVARQFTNWLTNLSLQHESQTKFKMGHYKMILPCWFSMILFLYLVSGILGNSALQLCSSIIFIIVKSVNPCWLIHTNGNQVAPCFFPFVIVGYWDLILLFVRVCFLFQLSLQAE